MRGKGRENQERNVYVHEKEEKERIERLPTALYARLSEAGDGMDADSIEEQLRITQKYLSAHPELEQKEVFIDRDFEKTDFEETEFVRMMEKVKTGEIRCVIVKDLSYFGRNPMEAGYYIETIFPMLQVRLIAVSDDFDSNRVSDRESVAVPVRNMVNSMFAKTVSKKQTIVNERKRKLGIQKSAVSPYGYCYSEEEQKLVKVPELAPFVEMVFRWTLAGVSRTEIAKRYALMKVPTPLEIVQRKGQYLNRSVSNWDCHTVKGLLINPVYAGIVAMGRTRQAMYDGQAKKEMAREDWVYHYDMHEAYVSREDYEKIDQSIRNVRDYREERIKENKSDREGFRDCFRGKVICGECGKPMPYALGGHSAKSQEFTFAYYRCISNKKISRCANQRIQQNFLKLAVAEQIRTWVSSMCEQKKMLEKLKAEDFPGNIFVTIRQEIVEKSAKIKELEKRLESLHSDFSEELLDPEEYQILKERTIQEIQQAEAGQEAAKQRKYDQEKAIENFIARTEELEVLLKEDEIGDMWLEELVQEIRVYNGNRIEVDLKWKESFEDEWIRKCLQGKDAGDDRSLF